MKKTRIIKFILLLIISLGILCSCSGEVGPKGEPGEDGHTPEITIGDNGNWFIDGVDTGVKAQGDKGASGISISKIEKTSSEGLIDTYTITFTDGTTTTFTVTNGKDGEQGIQGIQGVPGKDGKTPVITIVNGYWYVDGVNTGILAEGLDGETGNGISSVEKTSSEGLIDTYTITFTDGTTTTFTVTNGKDGAQGIQGIQGVPGKDGHTPVITIVNGYWYVDGVNTGILAEGLDGETGNGISSVEKTSSEGLIDTYTITFTDGTTTTFTVTNGKEGKDGDTPEITIVNGNWFIDGEDSGVKAQGESGKDGASLLTGNGQPSNDLGKNEDSYIDLESWDYYIKIDEVWSLEGNIKGEDGKDASSDYVGTEGLEFYPINDTECAVAVGKAKLLKEIVIPSKYKNYTVTTIYGVTDDGGFQNCYSLEKITLPNTIESIGEYAFYGCSSLTNIVISEGLESIGDYAFRGCSSLTNIVIPEGVESIGDSAFCGCSSLINIKIPNSITSIENNVFRDCISLTSVVIPEGLESIDYRAFEGCSSLTNIEIPNSVRSIGQSVFRDCISLTSVVISEGVESIGDDAFYNCVSLTSVVILEGLESIGNFAFSGCSLLTNIEIPNSVRSIGQAAFYNCVSLTSVVIPEGVESIGDDAFYNCVSLRSITLPFIYYRSSDTEIFDFKDIFGYGYDSHIPLEVILTQETELGYGSFMNCTHIQKIILPDTLITIDQAAFKNCTSLASIEIPNSVTSIGSWAFSGCSSLTNIEIPNSVTSIGYDAFSGCSSLTNLEIPDSVTFIGHGVIRNCTSMESITIPKADGISCFINDYFGSDDSRDTSFCLTSLKEVIISGGTTLDSIAFSNCIYIEKIILPEELNTIGSQAFANCKNLKSIVIPKSVTIVGYDAFKGCDNLNIYCQVELQPNEWHLNWNSSGRPIYWSGEWEYDINGNPVPLN